MILSNHGTFGKSYRVLVIFKRRRATITFYCAGVVRDQEGRMLDNNKNLQPMHGDTRGA
jgi:hypothetical protein